MSSVHGALQNTHNGGGGFCSLTLSSNGAIAVLPLQAHHDALVDPSARLDPGDLLRPQLPQRSRLAWLNQGEGGHDRLLHQEREYREDHAERAQHCGCPQAEQGGAFDLSDS
jgi:hypothetical protein